MDFEKQPQIPHIIQPYTPPLPPKTHSSKSSWGDRSLPSIQTNFLHPAYVSQISFDSKGSHVSFAAQQKPLQNSPKSPCTIHPNNFWLPSPQTPHTFDSRRSYLRAFAKPRLPRRSVIIRHPWFLRARRFVVEWFAEWWALELLSWCFSAMCMATIIAVLLFYNNERMPMWKFGFTLNSFVSVLSGFSRASLLLPIAEALGQLKWNWFRYHARPMLDFERLDMASRGPWGALVLLARSRRLSLASVGAAVMLLSLPVDLFFQQVVAYRTISIPQPRNSSTPAATRFDAPDSFGYQAGRRIVRPPYEFLSIVEQFSLFPGNMPELKSDCPTGNCTWPAFETLGVCSKCQPSTQDLSYGCLDAPFDWNTNGTYSQNVSYPIKRQCGYFFNKNKTMPYLMSGYSMNSQSPGEALGMRILPLRVPFTRRADPDIPTRFPDIVNPISEMMIASTPNGPYGAYQNATPNVETCVVYWCVKTIETTVYRGLFRENVAHTYAMKPSNTDPWFYSSNATNTVPTRYLSNFTLEMPSRDDPSISINFTVSNLTAWSTIIAFDPVQPAYVSTVSPSDGFQLRWYNTALPVGNIVLNVTLEDVPWLQPNNIRTQVDRIANALTRDMRNAADHINGRMNITGTSYMQQTYVNIRWVWIILPLTLLGMTLVFLVATVVRSSLEHDQVGIYKTSAIAILFNGLGDDVQRSVGPNCKMGDARNKARDLKVQLVPE